MCEVEINKYDIGDLVKLKTTTKNVTGVAVAPDQEPIVTVKLPDGTFVSPAVVAVVGQTGQYEAQISITQSGTHRYRWAATGSVQGAEENSFKVRTRQVNPS
jgi:hypothetical protein